MSEGIEELKMVLGWSEKHGHELLTISVEDGRKIVDYVAELEAAVKPVPAPVTLPETTRVDLGVLYPYKRGESASAWTNRVLSHAREHGTNRQCSIGWHGECSDSGLGEAAECNCICHGKLVETYTVEGDVVDGQVTVIRAERGKLDWPAQEGEPDTMWAWWVYARSETEAAVQGATKERNRLAGE